MNAGVGSVSRVCRQVSEDEPRLRPREPETRKVRGHLGGEMACHVLEHVERANPVGRFARGQKPGMKRGHVLPRLRRERNAQGGGLLGLGRTVYEGDKDYNRGTLNPKMR